MNRTMVPLRLRKYLHSNVANANTTTTTTTTKPTSVSKTTTTKHHHAHAPHHASTKIGFQPLGFVIVRCMTDKQTAHYWYKSYQCIRKLYPVVPIVIVDDNSNPLLRNHALESKLTHCRVIRSEYPACGEILGFYYFLKHRWFQKAVVLHDSVFLQAHVDFKACGPVRFIWQIETKVFDDVEMETDFLWKIGGPYLDLYENKDAWKGCFGVMAVIDHNFLVKIQDMFKVIGEIKTRRHRSCMERVFAVMCFHHNPGLMSHLSVMGDIHEYPLGWGYSFSQYIREQRRRPLPALVKVWTGR